MQHVSFLVDSQKVNGTLLFPPEKKLKNPAILFIHGWMSSEKNYITYAQELLSLGYICMTFNMRGNTFSEGDSEKLTVGDHLADCLKAYNYLAQQKRVDGNNIHVVGASYGGYLAVLLSQERKVKSLVLRTPAMYADKRWKEPKVDMHNLQEKDYIENPITADNNKALRALDKYNNKVLIIESEKDEMVPHTTIANYISVCKKNQLMYVVMKEVAHVISHNPTWQKEFVTILKKWFSSNPFTRKVS